MRALTQQNPAAKIPHFQTPNPRPANHLPPPPPPVRAHKSGASPPYRDSTLTPESPPCTVEVASFKGPVLRFQFFPHCPFSSFIGPHSSFAPPFTLNPSSFKPSDFILQPSDFNLQPSTFRLQPSTFLPPPFQPSLPNLPTHPTPQPPPPQNTRTNRFSIDLSIYKYFYFYCLPLMLPLPPIFPILPPNLRRARFIGTTLTKGGVSRKC